MLNLSGTAYGIGVQPGTLYFRSASDFAFYDNGTYSAKQDDPGGGSLLMLLDSRGDLTVSGALVVDLANENPGKVNPGLTFGLLSGEGISSQRTAGGNQYGLDFYTGFSQRMSITNGGDVGIGTNTPNAQLNLGGGAWNLSTTEGDFKIGTDTYRLKMGVALGGSGAGDVRIRAQGGTNRLLLGTGTADVLSLSGVNVGIGTISPSSMLEVDGDIKGTGNLNVSGKTTCAGDLVSNGSLEVDGSAAISGGLKVDGSQTIQGALLVKGNMQVLGSKSGYVVDHFYCRAKKPLARGDVVVLHTKPNVIYYGLGSRIPVVEVTLAGKASDTRVCGIVDEPALDASATPGLDRKSMSAGSVGSMVTLGAYAFCKVTADAGPIRAGDLLVTSEIPGHAQKMAADGASPAGSIIGKALSSLDEGRGTIPILISHQ
jgi:cytoskeletal protein CcmA (bactofilin family)